MHDVCPVVVVPQCVEFSPPAMERASAVAAAVAASAWRAWPPGGRAESRPWRGTRRSAPAAAEAQPLPGSDFSSRRCSTCGQIPKGENIECSMKMSWRGSDYLRGPAICVYLTVTFLTSISVAWAPESMGAMVPIGGTVGTEGGGGGGTTGCVAPYGITPPPPPDTAAGFWSGFGGG